MKNMEKAIIPTLVVVAVVAGFFAILHLDATIEGFAQSGTAIMCEPGMWLNIGLGAAMCATSVSCIAGIGKIIKKR